MKKFIQKYSLTAYFFLAYFISWAGILLSFGASGIQIFQGGNVLSEGFSRQLFYIWLAMLAGPSIAGIFLTYVTDRKNGIKKLGSSLRNWKIHIKWYAAALFIIPFVLLIIFYLFSLMAPKFYPASLVGFGIIVGCIGGFFEEIGWTGFALPRLQQKFTLLKAGIILGVIHTFWHLPADFLGTIHLYKTLYLLHFILWVIALTAFRILTVWIYNHTSSLLLAQVTHASFTGSQIIFTPAALNGPENVAWYAVFAISLWIIVGVIISKDRNLFFPAQKEIIASGIQTYAS